MAVKRQRRPRHHVQYGCGPRKYSPKRCMDSDCWRFVIKCDEITFFSLVMAETFIYELISRHTLRLNTVGKKYMFSFCIVFCNCVCFFLFIHLTHGKSLWKGHTKTHQPRFTTISTLNCQWRRRESAKRWHPLICRPLHIYHVGSMQKSHNLRLIQRVKKAIKLRDDYLHRDHVCVMCIYISTVGLTVGTVLKNRFSLCAVSAISFLYPSWMPNAARYYHPAARAAPQRRNLSAMLYVFIKPEKLTQRAEAYLHTFYMCREDRVHTHTQHKGCVAIPMCAETIVRGQRRHSARDICVLTRRSSFVFFVARGNAGKYIKHGVICGWHARSEPSEV